jgi:CBS domain-containing protein
VKIKERWEFAHKPAVYTLRGDERVSTAIKIMAKRNIGSVVVVDDDMKVQGIVTERDLVRRLLGEKRDPDATVISDIMSIDPRTAREDDDVVECLRLMSNERFRHLPIVDESGRLTSILSQGDFVAYTWPELLVLVRKKATEAVQQPSVMTLGAILLYTLAVIAIERLAGFHIPLSESVSARGPYVGEGRGSGYRCTFVARQNEAAQSNA